MRMILSVLACFLLTNLAAQSVLDMPVDMPTQGRAITSILDELTQTYPLDFYYTEKTLDGLNCTTNIPPQALATFVRQVLSPADLSYLVFNENAIIIAKPAALSAEWDEARFLAQRSEQITRLADDALIILGDPTNAKKGKIKLNGKVVDATTDKPIFGSTIFINSLGKGTTTDEQGNFDLDLKAGAYDFEIKSIGYENYEPTLQLWNADEWLIELIPSEYNLSQVTVTEQATDANIREVQVGVQRITPRDIKALPAFLGEPDVLKSLLTLPGVSTVGEGASGLNIRGGAVDQNLILQDGAPVFSSSHVLGLFSAFNADAIRRVSLFKGNIPAQYGGRLSSVLDIQTKNADFEEFKMQGGLGLVASKLTLEQPLVKEKTSLLISGRSSYSDYLLKLIDVEDVQQSSAYFYDGVVKLAHKFQNGSNISLSHYQSFDRFRFAQRFGYSWATRISTFQYNQLFSEILSGNLTVATGALENTFFQPTGIDAFNLTNGLGYWKAQPSIFLSINNQHKINAGVEWIRYTGKDESIESYNELSGRLPASVSRDKGQEWSAFINDEWAIGDYFSVNIGLRFTQYQHLGDDAVLNYEEGLPRSEDTVLDTLQFTKNEVIQNYHGWSPRLAAVYRFDAEKSVKFSYNRLHQFIHLISNTTVPTPVDIWQVSTPYLTPQRAHNFSLGYFQNFRSNRYESSIETYYRSMENVVDYKDFAQLLLQENLETELLAARGKAYGLELFFKKNKGKLTGQVSYTFARSLRQADSPFPENSINNGAWFPSNYDQPHTGKLNFQYKGGKRHSTSVSFVYSRGRPITAPFTEYLVESVLVPHYSERNGFRIPDYHRLDLSYTYRPNAVKKTRFKDSITFSIYNVYSRRNAFSVFFETQGYKTTQAFKLSVLGAAFPAITYNFEFN